MLIIETVVLLAAYAYMLAMLTVFFMCLVKEQQRIKKGDRK